MMMKLAVLAILGASVAAVLDSIITLYAQQVITMLPLSASMTLLLLITLEPLLTLCDLQQCVTQNLSQYFDVLKPLGMLSAAIDMYVDELVEPCLETAIGADLFNCCVTELLQLCGFTIFVLATPALITAFVSYESAAASFWRSNSVSVSSLLVECALAWNHFGELKYAWLNQTIAYASCVLEDLPLVSMTIASSGSSTALGMVVIGMMSSIINMAGLVKRMDMWMLAGIGVIAGAANVFA